MHSLGDDLAHCQPRNWRPPEQLNLIPDEHVSAKPIAEAVFCYVEAWSQGTILSSAVDDLLHRRPPRLTGHHSGPIISGKNLVAECVDVVRRMQNTVLCIQGPPGTGKTFTAAQAILGLLRAGKKVGATANSHKAILNVLRTVYEAMEKTGETFRVVKVGEAEMIRSLPMAVLSASKSKSAVDAWWEGLWWWVELPGCSAVRNYKEHLITYSLMKPVSFHWPTPLGLDCPPKTWSWLATRCSWPNLSSGTHPGDSGQSALNYLLAGHATIPPELGIFLDQTWRLHPDICQFISEALYDGRLKSKDSTATQRIETNAGLVSKAAGILFLPVEHAGNSQGCEEEACVIEQLVDELLNCKVRDSENATPRKITLADILIVAPFNMQVRLLKKKLGTSAVWGVWTNFRARKPMSSLFPCARPHWRIRHVGPSFCWSRTD